MTDEENETWILDAGGEVVEKLAMQGYSSLTSLERLIYCLWVADYGMRNAGDLTTAADLHAGFLNDGKSAARELGLARSLAAFSLASNELEQRYFALFDELADELRAAKIVSLMSRRSP